MERIKQFVVNHIEKLLILLLTGTILLIHYFVTQKMTFLNFYYLPVLVSGYVLGRNYAIYTSILSICLVVFLGVLYPSSFHTESGSVILASDLMIWGGFLFLASVTVGTLYEHKEKKIQELRKAYVGVIEILTKYLDSWDRYTKGHSLRVAEYASDIAKVMNLPNDEIENIKVAGLLHDIGKIDVSAELINKAASLTEEERRLVAGHTEKGAEILFSVGTVLREAIPIVLTHHKFFIEAGPMERKYNSLPLGARIIAVADSFDSMITDRPYRAGKPIWQVMEELDRESGNQFDPAVVNAFKEVMREKVEVV